jgi:hypothetical protein
MQLVPPLRLGVDTRDDDAEGKVQQHGIFDAVFRLLQGKPAPRPGKKSPQGMDANEEDAPDADADVAAEEDDEELTPEEQKAREELHAAREKFDAVVLPATRAVAHLCGAPGPLRRYAADAIVYMRSLYNLLEPLSSPSVHDAALRALASIAAGSTAGAATLAGFVGARDVTLPKVGTVQFESSCQIA